MDSDQGKLFIGGISWDTTEEKLMEHFSSYGRVLETVIMKDKISGRPRGFGFVVFADPDVLDRVLQDTHTLDGRTVEAKRALSRDEQQASGRSGGGGGGANIRTKKIFVGGLPATLTEDEFRQYFQNFGNVTDLVVMYDQSTQRPRGFGFISFDTEDAVDNVLQKSFHELSGKMVEVKRALPKDSNTSGGTGRSGGAASYQSYGGSGDGTQGAGAGYSAYSSSSYAVPNYGYGTAIPGAGYGGYGSAGGYAPRNQWSNQAPSGYGSSGYGGQPQSQGYMYGGYEGTYGNQGGYSGRGASAGNPSGGPGEHGGGYGGYGDANGNSGYTNAWRSDPYQGGGYGAGAQGGQGGYGGYGGAQSRQ